MAKGINKINSLSFSTKIFLIAGSNNQAMEAVEPAIKMENNNAISILSRYLVM